MLEIYYFVTLSTRPRDSVEALNSQVTPAQELEREKAYDTIASLLKIPFLDEDVANNSIPRKDDQPEVQGLAATLSVEKSASSSPIGKVKEVRETQMKPHQ